MLTNEQLVTKLFQCLNAHKHGDMADCYHENATFQDIAFRLSGREEIGAMWKMICLDNSKGKSDIQATVLQIKADAERVDAVVVDNYTFRKTGRSVVSLIHSAFQFRDGLILRQVDTCDPIGWAAQAFGPLMGLVPGRISLIRQWAAMRSLRKFMADTSRA